MKIVPCEGKEFKEIERNIFEIGCEFARMLMEELFEKMDKELSESRDKEKLRHKGRRKRTIKTLMGEVSVNRAIYRRQNEDGAYEHVYLLDEALGFDTIGTVSPNLVEKILGHICEMPYREVSKAVTELTNQTISHQGVWNIVQIAGEKCAEAEESLIKELKAGKLQGDKEVPVIFEEVDGLWLSMQGKSKGKAKRCKRELKMGVVYEGWKKRYSCSKEYKTVGKMAFAGYEKPEKFKDIRDALIAKKYNVDEIKYRILNGDGASWIKHGQDIEPETSLFQLDPYHLVQSVVRNVADKRARGQIIRWLRKGEFEKAFSKINKLKYECDGLAVNIEKLETLEKYIENNKEGIVPYTERKNVEIPESPQGIEYRSLGTMERNVNIFAKRMKGAKSWSEKGASNLSKIIALKIGKDFKDNIAALVSGKTSERLAERFDEDLKNTKRETLKKAAKKSIYPMQKGEIPFSNCKVTNGRKAIRGLFDMRVFSELIYR